MTPPTSKDGAPGRLETLRRFLNTVDFESGRDVLGSPTALRDWLVTEGLADANASFNGSDVARAIEVREAFRTVVFANTVNEQPDAAALAMLSDAGSAAQYRVMFHPEEGPQLLACAGGVDGALAALVAVMAQAMLDGSWSRFKACRREGCRWAFFDWTKNRSGMWCSMAVCGNRVKARCYQQRKRTRSDGFKT